MSIIVNNDTISFKIIHSVKHITRNCDIFFLSYAVDYTTGVRYEYKVCLYYIVSRVLRVMCKKL